MVLYPVNGLPDIAGYPLCNPDSHLLNLWDVPHKIPGYFCLQVEDVLAHLFLHVSPVVTKLLELALCGVSQGGVDASHVVSQDLREDSGPLGCVPCLEHLLLVVRHDDAHFCQGSGVAIHGLADKVCNADSVLLGSIEPLCLGQQVRHSGGKLGDLFGRELERCQLLHSG